MVVYWRDKAGHGVDFVLRRGRAAVNTLECKWNRDALDARGLLAFRSCYPKWRNYLVTPLEGPFYCKRIANLEVLVCRPEGTER